MRNKSPGKFCRFAEKKGVWICMYWYMLVYPYTNILVPFLDFSYSSLYKAVQGGTLNPVYLNKTVQGSVRPSNCLVLSCSGIQDSRVRPCTALYRESTIISNLVPRRV